MNKYLYINNVLYNFVNLKRDLTSSNHNYDTVNCSIRYDKYNLYIYDYLVCTYKIDELGHCFEVKNMNYIENYATRIMSYRNANITRIPYKRYLNYLINENYKRFIVYKPDIELKLEILYNHLKDCNIDWYIKYDIHDDCKSNNNKLSVDRLLYLYLINDKDILDKYLIPNINNIILGYIGRSL